MSGSLTPPASGATIPFSQIPAQWQVPGSYAEIQGIYGNQGVLPWPARALIIGQALAAATGPLGVPTQITRVADATAFWGAGSMVERMAGAFVAANPYVPLDVVAVADATSSAKATGNYTLGGTWTTAATLGLVIAGVRVPVGVLATDTVTTVVTAAVAAINTVIPGQLALPVVASAGGTGNDEIVLTARNAGVESNNILLELNVDPGDTLPAGMTCSVTAMTGGATNPTLAPVIEAITGIWYTDIVMSWTDSANVSALCEELIARYGAMEVEDGHGYVTFAGTLAQAQAAQAAANCQFLSAIPLTHPPSPPWAYSASLAGIASFALTNDPARQLRGMALPGIVGPRPADRWTVEEKNLLLAGGLSPVDVMTDGTVVTTRVVTTYLTNDEGVADPDWHEIMTPKVMSRIRYDWNAYSKLLYPSNKLSDNGSIASQYDSTVATPARLGASWATRYRTYEQNGWLENDALATQATFVRNANDPNRCDSTRPMQIIGNLMVEASVMQFQL
ncbi:MAG: hypothetical protein ACRDNS_24650 [Trebonia sp.]